MSSGAKLTFAFLGSTPKAAAQALQELPATEAAAFLDTVPTRLAAPVLHGMIPWQAARRLELIAVPRAAMILRQLPFLDAMTLTRLLGAEYRDLVMEELPTQFARRLRAALLYPRYQVGAWIDPEVPTLTVSSTVGDALRVLKEAGAASHIFLESSDHSTFLGTIEVTEILRCEPSAQLEKLKTIKSSPVSNRAALSSVTFDERWDESIHLPVVGRRGNFLGGLSRASLRLGLREQPSAQELTSQSALTLLIGALIATCTGVLSMLLQSASLRSHPMHQGVSDEQ